LLQLFVYNYNYEVITKCTDNLLKFFLYIYMDLYVEALLTQDSAAICITLVKVVQNLYCCTANCTQWPTASSFETELVSKLRVGSFSGLHYVYASPLYHE